MEKLLSSEQVDALQSVDVRLGWIRHGMYPNFYQHGFPRENGPAVFGLSDYDYAVPELLLSDMGPGDISARERIMNEGVWRGKLPTNAQVLIEIDAALRQSPYVTHNKLENYLGMFGSGILDTFHPDTIQAIPGLTSALESSLQTVRELRLVTPFYYVDGLAAIKGIRRAAADAPDQRLRASQRYPGEIARRNADMASELGNLAVQLVRSRNKDQTPKLAFTAGSGHDAVEDIFDSHNISYTSHTAEEPFADTFFSIVTCFGFPRTMYKRYARHYALQWFKNLREHGHTPVNAKLGTIRPWL